MELPESITAEDLHYFAVRLADECQKRSHTKFAAEPKEIVRGALFSILHDAVIVHRAIGELVNRGWSSPGAALARTMLDLTVSMVAIIKSKNPPLAAFRYFNASYRQIARDQVYSSEFRRSVRTLIRDQIDQLQPEDRPAAFQFLKEKDRPYWFWEEWKSPSEVIAAFASPKVQESYKRLSAAAHGGYLGLRVFRDRFDEYYINPRLPLGTQAILVSVSSSRYLIELVSIRSQYEELNLESLCTKLRELIERVELLFAEST
jgi:hypothetical protein